MYKRPGSEDGPGGQQAEHELAAHPCDKGSQPPTVLCDNHVDSRSREVTALLESKPSALVVFLAWDPAVGCPVLERPGWTESTEDHQVGQEVGAQDRHREVRALDLFSLKKRQGRRDLTAVLRRTWK